jgi:hypothetical protein
MVSTVIPGMRKLKYVQANLAVSDGKGSPWLGATTNPCITAKVLAP